MYLLIEWTKYFRNINNIIVMLLYDDGIILAMSI